MTQILTTCFGVPFALTWKQAGEREIKREIEIEIEEIEEIEKIEIEIEIEIDN